MINSPGNFIANSKCELASGVWELSDPPIVYQEKHYQQSHHRLTARSL